MTPEASQENQVVLIENWSVVFYAGDPSRLCFHSNLIGHPFQPNGTEATTSKILRYNDKKEVFVCISREYRLGIADPHYEEQFPNALEQILKSIKHVSEP